MQMKPAHFTLIRFHRVVTSECLQHPGNKGKDLRNVLKLKGHSSYGLSVCPFFFFKKKQHTHLYCSFSNLKQASKKSIQPDNKNSRPSALQQ